MNINEILDMLDWGNDDETQERGRQYAEQVKCLSVFMQPMDAGYNKNVGENCALILSKKEDALLTPYLFQLLDWLQDLNWPGAVIILERLQRYQNYKMLNQALEKCIVVAKALEGDIWLSNLAELVMHEEVKDKVDGQIYDILKEYVIY